jgi:hypothetical protein
VRWQCQLRQRSGPRLISGRRASCGDGLRCGCMERDRSRRQEVLARLSGHVHPTLHRVPSSRYEGQATCRRLVGADRFESSPSCSRRHPAVGQSRESGPRGRAITHMNRTVSTTNPSCGNPIVNRVIRVRHRSERQPCQVHPGMIERPRNGMQIDDPLTHAVYPRQSDRSRKQPPPAATLF